MKTVLITGSSTGIGYAIAEACMREGHKVIATMRNPESTPQLLETADREGLNLTVMALDVDRDSSVEQTFSEVYKRYGSVDVLVNNAGIGWWSATEDMPLEDYKQIMETNYFGVLRCIKAVLPEMRERKRGQIINISSVAGRFAGGAQGAYCASKWALEAVSESLAQEMLNYNVAIHLVEPGIIKTPIVEKLRKLSSSKHYPHADRLHRLFDAVMRNPALPDIVGEKVLEIMNAANYKLRYPVGPDARPYIQWRAEMRDEDWVALGGLNDEQWENMFRNDFGIPV